MNVARAGGWIIGAILLATGLAILASDIDLLVLCFKQCDLPKALSSLLGPNLLRILVGAFFVSLAALFIWPAVTNKGRGAKHQ
jgi:hypothetical protein